MDGRCVQPGGTEGSISELLSSDVRTCQCSYMKIVFSFHLWQGNEPVAHITALATAPHDMAAQHHVLSPNLKADAHVFRPQLGDHMLPRGQNIGQPWGPDSCWMRPLVLHTLQVWRTLAHVGQIRVNMILQSWSRSWLLPCAESQYQWERSCAHILAGQTPQKVLKMDNSY